MYALHGMLNVRNSLSLHLRNLVHVAHGVFGQFDVVSECLLYFFHIA